MSRLGLVPKLTLLFVLFAVVLLATVGLLSYKSGRTALGEAAVSELLSAAVEKQATLDAWIKERWGDIAELAAFPHVIEEMAALTAAKPNSAHARAAHDQLVQDVEPRAGLEEDFLAILVIEPQTGEVIASTDPREEGKFKEDRPFFLNGRRGPYVQNPYYSISLQAPAMTISVPLQAENGRLLGVMAARLNMEQLNAIISRRTGLRRTDEAFLVNTSSLFVTQPRLVPDAAILQRGIHTEAVERCLRQESGVVLAADYRGVPVIEVYRWLPDRQLCLSVKMDQAEAFAPSDTFGKRILLVSGVVLLVASALAFWLARGISRPVLALQAGAARFGQGELDVRLPETSQDELGLLAREFNTMAASLSEKERQLRTYAAELEQRVEERTEALRASNAELEQFAYVASHDLQEPLRMVSSYVQLLARRYRDRLDAEAQEFIAYAVDGAKRMQQLINDLLTYSRVGTRGKPFEPTDCEAVFEQAIANLQVAVQESGAAVTHDFLPTVKGDGSQLLQVFQNLIGNAIKFRRDESPRIHVSVERRGNDQLFSVRDNGIGIAPEYFDRIFVIFQRLHGREEFPGTGIGLAICKKIVERHGGRIWVESEPGKGSTIYFTIPAANDN